MKATGIVRRIDDLGRIVIPKEIRRSFHIREGDPVEIFTDAQESIVLRKYSSLSSLQDSAARFVALFAAGGKQVLFCDTDQVVLAQGALRALEGVAISPALRSTLTARRKVLLSGADRLPLFVREDRDFAFQLILPLVSAGDLLGGLLLLSNETVSPESAAQVETAARFLELQAQEV